MGCINMVTVSIRIEDQEKRALDEMLDQMGMNITTFYSIYTKRVLRDRRIPFAIEASPDPLYSEPNVRAIKRAEQQIEEGHAVVITMDQLEELLDA